MDLFYILFPVSGGFIGMHLGAMLQKFVPQRPIKLMPGVLIIYVSASYIVQFFR